LERTGNKSRFAITNDQIEAFLNDYRHFDDEHPLGIIEFDEENELKIVCNSKYLGKTAKEDFDFGFNDIL
jgi:hypothetical protein